MGIRLSKVTKECNVGLQTVVEFLQNHLLLLVQPEVVHILEEHIHLCEEVRVHHDVVAVDRNQWKSLLHDSLEGFSSV